MTSFHRGETEKSPSCRPHLIAKITVRLEPLAIAFAVIRNLVFTTTFSIVISEATMWSHSLYKSSKGQSRKQIASMSLY